MLGAFVRRQTTGIEVVTKKKERICMKTRKLRLLSFVLTVAMMFAVMPVSAFAAEITFAYPYEGQTLEYKIVDEKTVEVSTNQSIKGSVKIPKTVEYKGEPYTVVAIGKHAFFGDQQLTHVELPSTLKVIYALSDFLIMILSWLVKQSLRAFSFQEVQP